MASTDSSGNTREHKLEDQLKIFHEDGYLYVQDKTIGEELNTEAMRRGATDTAEFLAFVVKKTFEDKLVRYLIDQSFSKAVLAFYRLGGQGWKATPSEGTFVFQAYQSGVDTMDFLVVALCSNGSKFTFFNGSHRQDLPRQIGDRFIIVRTGDLQGERVEMDNGGLAMIDARLAINFTEGQALFIGFVHEDLQEKISFKPISIRDPEKVRHVIGDIDNLSDSVRINVVAPNQPQKAEGSQSLS
ncbi:MAG: hypothetical protein Q9179_007976 [Wetmoreana sp. 5 TL-2023]